MAPGLSPPHPDTKEEEKEEKLSYNLDKEVHNETDFRATIVMRTWTFTKSMTMRRKTQTTQILITSPSFLVHSPTKRTCSSMKRKKFSRTPT
jgi:hypothetical protein